MVKYRELDFNEVEQYAELYQMAFAEEPWNEIFDSEKVINYFDICCKNNMYGGIVADKDNIICGILTYYLKPSAAGTILYIDELMVCEEYRGKGIGSRLVMEVEKKARNYDVVSIIVHTESHTDA